MQTQVTAIIVNWNGKQDTIDCLDALRFSSVKPCHVIVVDNGSTDGSLEVVKDGFPEVEVLPLDRNYHFARGANEGIQRAVDLGAEYIWLLNNDARTTAYALSEMLRVMKSDATIGIAGACLIHPDAHLFPLSVVGVTCDLQTGTLRNWTIPDDREVDRVRVDYVWGAAMLIKVEVILQIGMFDEGLVAYFEDTDLCLRAKEFGWSTVGVPHAVVYHEGSKTADRVYMRQAYLRGRNWFRCLMRHARQEDRLRLAVWLVGRRIPLFAWDSLRTLFSRAISKK